MHVTALVCSSCATHYEPGRLYNLCPQCSKPLLVHYDLERAAGTLKQSTLATRPATLWHYRKDDDPLGFLLAGGKAATLPEAAYRFCRHELGVHTVLTGTGDVGHLTENVASLLKPPLAQEDLYRLDSLFGHVDAVSGN